MWGFLFSLFSHASETLQTAKKIKAKCVRSKKRSEKFAKFVMLKISLYVVVHRFFSVEI